MRIFILQGIYAEGYIDPSFHLCVHFFVRLYLGYASGIYNKA